tara:strand:+ start:328 stop:702 length:375 start_codon:yes stop_codon:yes gene_type:complete
MQQQIEIELGGIKRKFTFGILFLGNVLDRKEFTDFDDLMHKLTANYIKYAPTLMYESLVNTCNKYDKTVDFTERDVLNWLDDKPLYGITEINKFVNVFVGSTDNKTPVSDEKKSAKKVTVSKKK